MVIRLVEPGCRRRLVGPPQPLSGEVYVKECRAANVNVVRPRPPACPVADLEPVERSSPKGLSSCDAAEDRQQRQQELAARGLVQYSSVAFRPSDCLSPSRSAAPNQVATLSQRFATPSRPVARPSPRLMHYNIRTYTLLPFSGPKSATDRFTQMLPNVATQFPRPSVLSAIARRSLGRRRGEAS